jgi:hypothetical protein
MLLIYLPAKYSIRRAPPTILPNVLPLLFISFLNIDCIVSDILHVLGVGRSGDGILISLQIVASSSHQLVLLSTISSSMGSVLLT